jgi:predicted outer membrane repeat protein
MYCVSHRYSPTITNCTISGNYAEFGGGGIECSSYLTISNSTIIGNTSGWGGGIDCWYSFATITNCTIAWNTAVLPGGGVYCLESLTTIANSILWKDSPGAINVASGGLIVA